MDLTGIPLTERSTVENYLVSVAKGSGGATRLASELMGLDTAEIQHRVKEDSISL
jgi:hypothetical protein